MARLICKISAYHRFERICHHTPIKGCEAVWRTSMSKQHGSHSWSGDRHTIISEINAVFLYLQTGIDSKNAIFKGRIKTLLYDISPVGIWCQNDVVLTSMRRHHVASTSIRRHFDTKCPLRKQ